MRDTSMCVTTKSTVPFDRLHSVITDIILAIGAFGIIGNALNIFILTRKRTWRWSRGTLENVAYTGLVALAVSDMVYCMITCTDALLAKERHLWYYNIGPRLIFHYCSKYLQNVFSYCSTWLTVLMALNRYLAICHPIYARVCVSHHILWKVITLTFIAWFLLLLPELLERKIRIADMRSHVPCLDGKLNLTNIVVNNSDINLTSTFYMLCSCMAPNDSEVIYRIDPEPTKETQKVVFQYFYNILGFLVPVILMIYCNVMIVMKLREARRMRREYVCAGRGEGQPAMPDRALTYTLVIVVLMFLLLVSPSEVCNIVSKYVPNDPLSETFLQTAVSIADVMNTLNFATNFLLYCIVNVHFRRTVSAVFCRPRNDSNNMPSCIACPASPAIELV